MSASIAPLRSPSPTDAQLPISLLQSGQFLMVSPKSRGGLMIQKPHYIDFAGPGAAVGSSFDTSCVAIYPMGDVRFCIPEDAQERQQAFYKRIAYSQRLMDIAKEPSSLRRAHRIVQQLRAWIGPVATPRIPLELIAGMAGVLPRTVAIAQQRRLPEPAYSPSDLAAVS